MTHDYAQRRRIAVAAAITVIVAPAAFLLDRGGDDTDAGIDTTFVATVAGESDASDPPATAPVATDVMGTTPVGYLDGTAAPRDGDPATIAIPRLPQAISGTASFRRSIGTPTACQVKGVPFNSTVTVTNLDNSRSVQCIASVGGAEPDDDVILHADAFVQIADLTDAPVPVQITW